MTQPHSSNSTAGAGQAASAPYIAQAGEHQDLQWLGGMRLRVLLDAAATGGQLTLIEEFTHAGDATPRHVHSREDEIFFVLEGSMRAWVGEQRHELGAGGIVLLPRGIPHAYRTTSETAHLLMLCTPAGIEQLFREAGWDLRQPVPEGWAVSMPRLMEVTTRLGQQVLGPPPSANE